MEYAGGADAVLEKAERDFEQGDYRKAAYAAQSVVFADPKNEKARFLAADAYEQLGYASEPSIWRNAYLQGAYELRFGVDKKRVSLRQNTDLTRLMSADLLLKYIGISIDYDKTGTEADLSLALTVNENTYGNAQTTRYALVFHSGILLTYPDDKGEFSDYAKMDKLVLFALLQKNLDSVKDLIETNCYDSLKRLESYIVNIPEFRYFEIMESNEQ